MIYERLAFDAKSVRSIDENGFLHVKVSPLTRVQVAEYLGREVPGWEKLGLDPQKIYKGYRPAEELQKPETIKSVNGIPIQQNHHADFADDPAKDTRVGATGDEGHFKAPFLLNSLHIFDQDAINRIRDGSMRELSLAYRYDPEFTPGTTPDGQEYDFIMRNINANHLALCEEGRAGPQVLVMDSKNGAVMTDITKDDDAVEKQEIEIANQMAALAKKLNDLHKTENGEVTDITKDNDQVEAIIAELIEKGLDEDTARSFTGKLNALKGGAEDKEDEDLQATDDGEEVDPAAQDEDEVLPAEDEDEEPQAEDEDEDQLVKDACKACGLGEDNADDPDVLNAFKAGMKQGDKEGAEDDVDPEAQDSEDEPKNMATDSAARIAKAVERKLKLRFQAAEECKKTLGNVRPMAYDSAAAIYRAALKKEGISTKRLKNSQVRTAYLAYVAGKNCNAKSMALDSKRSSGVSGIAQILGNVSRRGF